MYALAHSDEIWAEDTRVAQQLLSAYQLPPKKLKRVDHHTGAQDLERELNRVQVQKLNIVYISDAGTPGVSDPGGEIVAVARKHGVAVAALPGASALSVFVSLWGGEVLPFCFFGFFPRDDQDKKHVFSRAQSPDPMTVVFFESPERIRHTVRWLETELPPGLRVKKLFFAKELTKKFEKTVQFDSTQDLCAQFLREFDDCRGEWVFGVQYFWEKQPHGDDEHKEWEKTLKCLMLSGVSSKVAAALVHQEYGIAKNLAYEKSVSLKKNVESAE